jgi:predicted dehydrogenase/threonine dehydrogenase-like Zn-dependent dehydrogenase
MKQVIRKGIRDIIVDEVPEPMVAAHHVLIRPVASLISSGTETASIHQDSALKEVADNPSHLRKIWSGMQQYGPLRTLAEVKAKYSQEYAVIGYSGAGIVADKHPTVTDLSIGDRVAYGGEGTGHCEVVTTGRNLVARVPDGVPFERACFATLGSIALNAVRIASLSLGDTVVVIGLGLVGQIVAQLARAQGGVVIASDLKPDRIELAGRLGAAHVAPGDTLTEAVQSITNGRGADCVIVAAAAKSAGPCHAALSAVRDRGRIVVVGAVDVSFPWNEMYLKEVQLFMSRAYGPGSYDPLYEKQGQDYPVSYVRWTENRNMEEFLRLVAIGQVQVEPLVTHRFPLAEAPAAYGTILDASSNSLAVLLQYPEAAGPYEPKRRIEIHAVAKSQAEIGVGLCGPGSLARWAHLPNLKKIPGVKLRAIHSSSGARAKGNALRFGAAYCCTDYQEMLADSQIDVIAIASRNPQHGRQAVEALRAGKHVFVEKPMALTEEECRELCRAVRESGKQLTVGFNRRFAPFFVEMKKHLGRRKGPAVVNCRVNSPGISGSYWMADPAAGGAILGEACHFVDLMYWLLDSEPVRVSAYSLPTGKQDPIGENNITSSFHFADGSIGSLTYCTVGSKTSGGERVEAFAPGLGLKTESFQRLEIQTGLSRSRKHLWPEKGYERLMESFFRAIREGRPPEVTAVDGLRATLGCLKILESARTLQPVNIDLEATLAE